jgi:hypothetical protein
MKTKIMKLTAILVLLLSSIQNFAATSVKSGNFNDPATWGGTLPVAGESITINSGDVVTITATPAFAFGNVTLKEKLVVNTGVSVSFGIFDFSGTSNILDIYGTVSVSSVKVTANSNQVNVYAGGAFTVSGNVQLLGSSQTLTVSNSGTMAVGGDLTNNPANTVNVNGSLTVEGSVSNSGTINVGTTGTLTADPIDNSGTINQSSGGTINGTVSGNSVLPVELLSFSAIYIQNHTDISWSTATEINNDYFVIEYSVDAQNWEVLNYIKGSGNSSEIIDYTYQHFTKNSYYYRLKQVDYDGKSETFATIFVNTPYINEDLEYEVYDILGRYLTTGKFIEIQKQISRHGQYILKNNLECKKITL